MLNKLGFYRELEYGDPKGPSIIEKQQLNPELKSQVLDYVESAPVIAASPSIAIDYFTGQPIASHDYVRTYDAPLDAGFLSMVETGRKPDPTDKELEEAISSLTQL